MQRAKNGDRVTIHYIGTLDNGHIFDQCDDDQPFTFTIGAGEVFPAMEQDIVGMQVGEVKNIHLSAEQAYGPRLKENLIQVSRQIFPEGREICVGQKLVVELVGNEQQVMRVRHLEEQHVVLDGNHDLAGYDLTFALRLVKID
jgi:FKBP-type peptidyl-prolyl cis-trans isomerase 2